MLIYNSQKEFLGIDDQDLKTLGFKSFTEMRAQAADFADFFVKTPGHIHNFKHVHWIDFITCADSTETPKVIIYANDKSFKCNVNVATAYLVDNPSNKAYFITLQNIRELSKNENSEIAHDLITKPTPVAATTQAISVVAQTPEIENVYTPKLSEEIDAIEDDYDTTLVRDELEEEPLLAEPQELPLQDYNDTVLDAPLDIDLEDDFKLEAQEEMEAYVQEEAIAPQESLAIEEEYDNSYVFDPKIASDELGLPVDLIEEFIEDFIGQANDFKAGLYESLQDGDIDNLKILSHKLKGVAANLRVEDAFEVLTTINTSEDLSVIRKNLNHFYIIIAKLSGEDVSAHNAIEESKTVLASETEDLVLEFKDDFNEEALTKTDVADTSNEDLELLIDDVLSVEDSAVPQKIDIPELADDDFVDSDAIDALAMDKESLAVDIETVDVAELSEEVAQIDELPDLLNIDEEIVEEVQTQEILDFEEIQEKKELQEIKIDEPLIEEPLLQKSTIDYNKTEVANDIGLDRDTFNEFLEDYVNDSKALCDSIKDAISSNDSIKWQREAVKLKGMSDNMRIHSFTSELETLLNTLDADIATQAVNNVLSTITIISNLEN